MTELEAVNTILATIGEAGIASLSADANEITDSGLAQRTLKEVSRDVQSEAWSWNTDEGVTINKTAADTYVVPGNTLTVDFSPNRYPDMQYVMRGLKVYDRNNQRYDFGKINGGEALVAAKVVSQLQWSELPHAAQQPSPSAAHESSPIATSPALSSSPTRWPMKTRRGPVDQSRRESTQQQSALGQ